MDLGIAGKRAVVIGGSAGLGLASAEALAAEGVDVTLFARNQSALDAAATAIRTRFGLAAAAVAGDLTRREDLVRLATALRAGGGLDILVLNTPRPPSPMRDFLDETEDARWEDAYRNQLHGALNVLRELAPLLRGKGWGRLVAITSASVKQPMPRHAVSTIFRAGVHAALKHLVMELGPDGVTVNAVAPATIVTPTFTQFHNLEARIAPLPLKRAGRPEELGAIVAFLASNQAGFLTGQTLQLDGGMTLSLL
jgi:3-oxoacyl-[acyl-carrier protein] reductase